MKKSFPQLRGLFRITSQCGAISIYLRAVGDIGSSIFDWSIGKKAEELLNKEELSKEDAIRLVSLLDSNYIAMDRQSVENAVSVILNSNTKDPLENRKWNNNAERIVKEIEKAFSGLNVNGKFAEIEFESDFNIVSYIARKAVWKMDFDAVLVVNRNFNGLSQCIYALNQEQSMIFQRS